LPEAREQIHFNKKLVKIAAAGAAAAGAETTYLELRDLALPLFDEDLEAKDGLRQAPENSKTCCWLTTAC